MRKLETLDIRDVRHLCQQLGTSKKELDLLLKNPDKHYFRKTINTNGKTRRTATPTGRLRKILDRLQKILQRISLPDYIQGGRKGYSNISNAKQHLGKQTIMSVDIKNYFPSVSNKRIYQLFTVRLGCRPNVARYLTRLTTLDGSLPIGSPTSTILGVLVSENLSKRVHELAKNHRSDSTQYIDDTAISGPSYIEKLQPTVRKIIQQEGFRENKSKTQVMHKDQEQFVTGVRVNSGLDVSRQYLKTVNKRVNEIEIEVKSGTAPLKKKINSVKGKISYISQLNKGAGRHLKRKLERILRATPV